MTVVPISNMRDGEPAKALDHALAYAALGWHVLPLYPIRNGACACVKKLDCEHPGKHPHHFAPTGHRSATTDPDTIRQWWSATPDLNIGIAMRASGLIAVDVDPRNGGDPELLPFSTDTLTAKTGGGGMHFIYALPDGYEAAAGRLMEGIDIKYEGYIACEPSLHITGLHYRWLDWDALTGEVPSIAPAPADIIRKYGEREAVQSFGTEWISEVQIRELRATLATFSSADRDLWIRVLHALASIKNEGVGYDLALKWSMQSPEKFDQKDFDRVWNSCRHTRSHWKAVFNCAKDNGGRVVTLPTDPLPIENRKQAAGSQSEPRFKFLSVAELMNQPPMQWRVKGVLPAKGLAVLYGASGSGKTFSLLDLLASVERGIEWCGRRVKQGTVAYVASEGALRNRVMAYMKHHELDDMPGFHTLHSQVNLLKGDDPQSIVEAARPFKPCVLVVDTLNRAMPGGNENSSEDMGLVIMAGQWIAEELDCLVIFVHHSGKDEAKGARGHSSLKAAVEAELSVTRAGDIRTLRVEKVRDGEDAVDILRFKLAGVELFTDEDGDTVTSCVIEPTDEVPVKPAVDGLPTAAKDVWQAITEACAQHPLTADQKRVAPRVGCLEMITTVTAARERFDILNPVSQMEKGAVRKKAMNTRKNRWSRGFTDLTKRGWIRLDGDFVVAQPMAGE